MADLETANELRLRMRTVMGLLTGYAYRYASEAQLHDRLAQVLDQGNIAYERERVLDPKNRADFWLDGLAIEVKVDGSLSDALEQVGRYINLPEVGGVLLASTRAWANTPLVKRPKRHGKPFAMIYIRRQAL